VDAILVIFAVLQAAKRGVEALRRELKAIIDVGRNSDKALAIVLSTAGMLEAEKIAYEVQGECLEAKFPVDPSVRRAGWAIRYLTSYCEGRDRGL
jgi:hypothetical protein